MRKIKLKEETSIYAGYGYNFRITLSTRTAYDAYWDKDQRVWMVPMCDSIKIGVLPGEILEVY